mmetsp:Transcript_17748/g.29837  ORF Transcript_17748/g.29837 Transcript_17748/m.29837 type:complete len:248 (+) Transcript_17748:232-975(+)
MANAHTTCETFLKPFKTGGRDEGIRSSFLLTPKHRKMVRSVCRCDNKPPPSGRNRNVVTKATTDGVELSRRSTLVGVSCLTVFGTLESSKAAVVSTIERNERTVVKTSSGLQFTDLRRGNGEAPRIGTTVAAHIKAEFEDGQVFLDTREVNTPLVWTVGIQSPLVTEGLEEAVLSMRMGGRRLATVPPYLAYKDAGLRTSLFGRTGKGKSVYYTIELLRCSPGSKGLVQVCCAEEAFPCKEPERPPL